MPWAMGSLQSRGLSGTTFLTFLKHYNAFHALHTARGKSDNHLVPIICGLLTGHGIV